LPVLTLTFGEAFGGVVPPFPLRSKGNFPSILSGNCQPGFAVRTLAAHFFLDTQNWRGINTGSSCSRSKPARTPPAPYSALTQQNLCYFVAFVMFNVHNQINCPYSTPSYVSDILEKT